MGQQLLPEKQQRRLQQPTQQLPQPPALPVKQEGILPGRFLPRRAWRRRRRRLRSSSATGKGTVATVITSVSCKPWVRICGICKQELVRLHLFEIESSKPSPRVSSLELNRVKFL